MLDKEVASCAVLFWPGSSHVYWFVSCERPAEDILVLLTSTVAHDAAHMGTNNAFLVNTQARFVKGFRGPVGLQNEPLLASLSHCLLGRVTIALR